MKTFYIVFSLFLLCHSSISQVVSRFTINTGETERIDAPVCVSLNGLNYNTDKGDLILFEVTNTGEKEVLCQLEPGYSASLWFVLSGITKKSITREYIIKLKNPIDSAKMTGSKISLKKDEKDLSLLLNEKPILNYRFGSTYPPAGVNPLFKRSGFIHPLWSPEGKCFHVFRRPTTITILGYGDPGH